MPESQAANENNLSMIELLEHLNPSRDALFAWLKPQITEDDLSHISHADYSMGLDTNWPALLEIYNSSKIERQAYDNCSEVLFYSGFTTKRSRRWAREGRTDHQEYLTRLYACAILNMAFEFEPPYNYYNTDTLNRLIESCLVLGEEATRLTLQLLGWRTLTFLTSENIEELEVVKEVNDRNHLRKKPFLYLSIFLLAVAVKPGLDDAILNQLAQHVIGEEARIRVLLTEAGTLARHINYNNKKKANPAEHHPNYMLPDGFTDHWLLGLDTGPLQSWELWKELANKILLNPPTPHSPQTAYLLSHIGKLLIDGSEQQSK